MSEMYRLRFLIGILFAIGLVILVIVLIFSNSGPSTTTAKGHPIDLTSYANTDTVVQFLDVGPITYDGTHRAVQITVGRDENSIEVQKGYQGGILSSNVYPSNEAAYNEFLHALVIQGFTLSKQATISDIGACATGQRFYFEIISPNGNNIQKLWSVDCNKEGSFAGNTYPIQALFQAQIPDFYTETAGSGL